MNSFFLLLLFSVPIHFLQWFTHSISSLSYIFTTFIAHQVLYFDCSTLRVLNFYSMKWRKTVILERTFQEEKEWKWKDVWKRKWVNLEMVSEGIRTQFTCKCTSSSHPPFSGFTDSLLTLRGFQLFRFLSDFRTLFDTFSFRSHEHCFNFSHIHFNPWILSSYIFNSDWTSERIYWQRLNEAISQEIERECLTVSTLNAVTSEQFSLPISKTQSKTILTSHSIDLISQWTNHTNWRKEQFWFFPLENTRKRKWKEAFHELRSEGEPQKKETD